MLRVMTLVSVAALLAACGGSDGQAETQGAAQTTHRAVRTDPPNALNLNPAFAGQTRGPEVRSGVAYEAQTYVGGLEKPWGSPSCRAAAC